MHWYLTNTYNYNENSCWNSRKYMIWITNVPISNQNWIYWVRNIRHYNIIMTCRLRNIIIWSRMHSIWRILSIILRSCINWFWRRLVMGIWEEHSNTINSILSWLMHNLSNLQNPYGEWRWMISIILRRLPCSLLRSKLHIRKWLDVKQRMLKQ